MFQCFSIFDQLMSSAEHILQLQDEATEASRLALNPRVAPQRSTSAALVALFE